MENEKKRLLKDYSDAELIAGILQKKLYLFEELVRRYNSLLYRIGRAYNYNHQDTEDLMQEAHISAYSNLSQFENRSSYKTWLTRIMVNQCYQRRKKFSSKNEIVSENLLSLNANPMFQESDNYEKNLINKELKHVIEEALQKMPLSYRMVFVLREVSGFSVAETAAALGILDNNVKIRTHRAKGMLRNQIEKMYSRDDIWEFNLIYCDGLIANVMEQINLLEGHRANPMSVRSLALSIANLIAPGSFYHHSATAEKVIKIRKNYHCSQPHHAGLKNQAAGGSIRTAGSRIVASIWHCHP